MCSKDQGVKKKYVGMGSVFKGCSCSGYFEVVRLGFALSVLIKNVDAYTNMQAHTHTHARTHTATNTESPVQKQYSQRSLTATIISATKCGYKFYFTLDYRVISKKNSILPW